MAVEINIGAIAENDQPTVGGQIEHVVMLPTQWQVTTEGGSVLVYNKGLTFQVVIDSYYGDRGDTDKIVSVINLAI